ncbi:sulfatase : Sulfatase atsG OS=Rhodopirellula baltica SWK14 GN=RBSWK_00910 PE=4 SV=1: Sulfatase [Gemmataceae bacterium]|nr:sulfatase : Sulfatase atsG OS=Rhodopirellula baltica SWK14 GN=RBSWK_00910 PE=4 SV=1: Sulfatase [Gemmataceae bacterium]VTT99778.1 sulfatase : Sulfatase atsG OS=Rhodopirellula baltica SWK14 GN=RBSWK_00910 PE=4 SV=1: Sulfatase [Gemmataceae bacterium]
MYRLAALVGLLLAPAAHAAEPARPNIVWIVVDDMSANFSCYGEKLIRTPHVDKLAAEGTRFSKAFVTAPVCSPCRSALITGCYQTTIGAHHHRSGRGELKITLPGDVVPAPVLFQKAGYYTCIGGFQATGDKLGKTDYNFEWDRTMYDGNDWAGRKPGQPFFMQVQLHGGKYRGQGPNANWQNRVKKELGANTDPAAVVLPPYYPRDPVILQDWADYLDCCRYTDKEVGDVVARLEKEKLLDNTVVFFMTDHGISHARGKQFLYDEGTHVPFVVRGPGIAKGATRDDLIEHIDLTATSLALAGIDVPKWMQGRNVLAKDYAKRDAVFAARDRCDETMEHIRSVRTDRFKYIRNYMNQRPHLQPCRYKDEKAIVQKLRDLHAAKKLDDLTEKLLFAETRPAEELYDLAADPHEVTNLAADPKHKATLEALRKKLAEWEESTGDRGRTPEPMAMYDSDMKVYLGGGKKDNTELKRNIELNKTWAKEGK